MDGVNVNEDDDMDVVMPYLALYPPRGLRRPYVLRDRLNPLEFYDDVDFRTRYRISKVVFCELLDKIQTLLRAPDRNKTRSLLPVHQLCIARRFYSSGSFQVTVGDLHGVCKATVCRVVKRVTLAVASLARDEVRMPTDAAERAVVMKEFYDIARIPAVLGALDCTHIPIQSPGGDNAELYRNRKGYFSLNVQCVVDAHLVYQNVVSRWFGSAHDTTIFNDSRLRRRFEIGEINDCYLVADGGYPCRPYLLTPVTTPTTQAEMRYNSAHIRTRNCVERSFGVLKRRFPSLRMGLRINIQTAAEVVVACVVLHNRCIHAGDRVPPDDAEITSGRRIYEEVPAPATHDAANGTATAFRSALINNVFRR